MNKRWRRTLGGLALLMVAVLGQPALALAQASSEAVSRPGILHGFYVGLLAHDLGGLWSSTRAEGGVDLNAEIVFRRPHFMLWEGVIRPNVGLSVNTQGDTSKIYAGAVWEFQLRNGFFFNTGAGLALHNGQLESDDANKKQLGSRVLFRVPIEFGVSLGEGHRISIMFDHISNADLADPNEGLDTLGLRYGFQF